MNSDGTKDDVLVGHAYVLDGQGGGRQIDLDGVRAWKPEDGALWLHFDLTHGTSRKWLEEERGIPPVAIDALLDVESRPRLNPVGAAALLAFRGVNTNQGATPDDMIGIRIWIEEGRVITSYRRELRSVGDVLSAVEAGDGAVDATDIVTALASRLVYRMTDTVDNLEDLIDGLEEQLLAEQNRGIRLELASLRRQIIALRRYMAPQREALASLIGGKFKWLAEDQRLSLRETSDRLSRHLEDLDAIRERAAVTQEELASRIAEEQNVRTYVLSIVAAIFLPLGFLTGLLGINIGGIPGADNPAAFWIFGGMLVLIVGLQIVFFKAKNWF